MTSDDRRLETRAIRAGRANNETALAPVLWASTTFVTPTVDEGHRMATEVGHDRFYSRYGNPTVNAFEAAIAEHPAVYEVAVFGIPHRRLGEELACSVYLKTDAALTADELQAHVGERLASFKVPSVVEFSAEMLPRSPQGKILKRVIRDELVEARS